LQNKRNKIIADDVWIQPVKITPSQKVDLKNPYKGHQHLMFYLANAKR